MFRILSACLESASCTFAFSVVCLFSLRAEPLSASDVGELANKYGLTSKVTTAKASGWYPGTIYSKLDMEAVQNLYAASNPTFVSDSARPVCPLLPSRISRVALSCDTSLMEAGCSEFDSDVWVYWFCLCWCGVRSLGGAYLRSLCTTADACRVATLCGRAPCP